ncbi:MAG: helix-hairpin-helix domain-containing protein [Lachnospiraceae bacterium]|nr:helix-hairpin-helix domain-containing protein [Lachnospiraceae bacterium]
MNINLFGFKGALCILGIISVLSVSGCGASENDISFGSATFTEEAEDAQIPSVEEPADKKPDYVYVCGHVNRAGVYAVSENTRMFEVINLAGGVKEDADISGINQAEKVSDGQQIYVPSKEETRQAKNFEGPVAVPVQNDDGLVNINTADAAALQTLTGIGASRAQAIIDFRNENGAFESIDDIKKVAGIKDGMFSKIKDQIKVR